MAKTNQKKRNGKVQQVIDKTATNIYENLGSERRRIVGQTLQLLANGCSIPPDEVSIHLRISQDKVISTLKDFGAESDKQGNIVGLGLTLVPTPHVYNVDGRKLYAWCAADTLAFPVMLKQNARIESTDPLTGEKIHISVTPDRVEKVEPRSAVVSWVKNIDVKNIRRSGCNNINFFGSPETASKWIAEHPDQTFYPANDVYKTLKEKHLNKYQDIMSNCEMC